MAPEGFVPFPAERAAAYRAAGYWTATTLGAMLATSARRWPDRIAVADGTARLSYAELDAAADAAAAGLTGLGIDPGDRVLLQLPNGCRFVVALFGLLRAGAIPVMCLPGHRAAELSHLAAVSDATALVIADTAGGFDYRPMAAQLVGAHPRLRQVIVDGDPGPFVSWPAAPAGPFCAPATDPESPALLLVSGGTTGVPKLIPRTHDDYVYNATTSAEVCALSAGDVYLVALPAGHNFALACPGLLGALSVGATTVFVADASPESAFAAIVEHQVTVTALVPALANLWAQACDWEPVTPRSLRLVQVGGAKLGADDARRVRAALGARLQQVFGMAEGLVACTRLDDPVELVENTQGRPLSDADELCVVDEADRQVAPGEDGELLVRGPYTLNGYFRAEAVNQRSFTGDGFYRTGDKVRRSADGYLQVTGRVKDVILRGGETVAAADLEEHLLGHQAIRAAAAVGLPDPFLGERICAAVVFHDSPVTMTELNAYLDARGAAIHARPDTLVAVPDLPMTPVGKTDKHALAAQLAG